MKTTVEKFKFIAKIARKIACLTAFFALSASADDVRTLGYATSGAAAALPAAPDMGGTVVNVTAAQAQYVLDGAYGSIDGKTINFTESVADTLVLGRASKYEGSGTLYRHGKDASTYDSEAMSYEDFIAYKNQATWTESCYYERTVENVTFTADADVVVNFTAEGGAHVYAAEGETAPVYDYVRDTGEWVKTGSCFFKRAILKNITFKGLTFKAKTNFETSESTTVFDGFTFTGCTFEIGSTAAGNYALRYYDEYNNGNVRNLVVENCTFKNCYQGIYTHHVKGITVKDCAFDTTGHNAIAIQSQGGEKGACDHGAVVITGNTFKNIGDRIIRFNEVGTGTTITIADNTADGNSGKLLTGKREIVAATSLPENAAEIITASNNDWGANAVAEGVFADAEPSVTGVTVSGIAGFEGKSFESFAAAYEAIKPIVEKLGLGQEGATAEQFDALFTAVDANGDATITYTISGNVVYDETNCENLLSMGRKASHYGNGRHLINFKFVGKTGKDVDTLTVNSGLTLPYEWWSEKKTTGIHFENLTLAGSAPNGLYAYQSYFEGIDFSVANCILKGLKIYNCSNVSGSYSITDSVLDGTGAPANSYAIHLQGNETAPLAITIKGNTITGYDRGVNIDQKTAVATISENTISVNDAGRSCIQLTQLAETTVSGNKLNLTGGNAITLHEQLLGLVAAPKISVTGNTVEGEGYLVYDDAAANGKAFTADNLALTYGTDNTVAETVDTTKGVKGSTVVSTSVAVNNVIQHYVATVGETGYASLADALAAAKDGDVVDLLANATVSDYVLDKGVTIRSAGETRYEIKGLKAIAGSGVTLENVFLNLDQTLDIGGTDTTLKNCAMRAKDVGYWDIVDGKTTGFTGGTAYQGNAYTYLVRVSGTRVSLTDCLIDGTDNEESYFPNMCLAPVTGTDVTMTRCTFNEGYAACYYSTPRGTWTLEDCTFTKIFCYNIQAGDTAAKIVVKGCSLAGWTSFGSSMTEVSFEDCAFAKSSGYATIVAYKNATFSGCTFTEDYKDNLFVEANTAVDLNGCSVVGGDGQPSATVSLAGIVELDDGTAFAALDATKDENGKYTAGTFVGSADAVRAAVAEDRALKTDADGFHSLVEAVAQIGSVGYASLAEAIAAAKEGETVTLLADIVVEGPNGTSYNVMAGVTLDLNGHSVDGSNVGLNYANPAALGLNVEGEGVLALVNTAATAARISGYVPLLVASSYGDPLKVEIGDGIELAATAGGTGNGVQLDSSVYLAYDDKTAALFKNGGFKAVVGGEARIYANFDSASDKADDTTAVLLNDYAGDQPIKVMKYGKGHTAFTLDLDGHSYTYTGGNTYGIVNLNCAKALTVKNGTLADNAPSAGCREAGVKLEATGAKVTLENVVVETTGTYGVATSGSNKENDVTLVGTTIRAANGVGVYFPSTGTLTIDGGAITGLTGVQVCAGRLLITGEPTITATGAGQADIPSSGAVLDGAAVSVVIRTGYGAFEGVTISGGQFTSAAGVEALQAYAIDGTEKTAWAEASEKVSVSGGRFSTAVPPDYCAAGFIPTANDDGTYGVKEGAYVAAIGEVKYETLEAALAAAQDGETVKMLADAELTAAQTIAQTLVLDLNGKAIRSTVDKFLVIAKGGDLTVNDATNEGRIENTAEAFWACALEMKGGVLTVNGGTIAANTATSSYSPTITVATSSSSTINLAGGRIEAIRTANHAQGVIELGAEAKATLNVTGGEIVGSGTGIRSLVGNEVNVSGGTIVGQTGNAVYSSRASVLALTGGLLESKGASVAFGMGTGNSAVTIGREGGSASDVMIPSMDFDGRVVTVNLLSGTVKEFRNWTSMTVEKVSLGAATLLVGTDISTKLPGSNLLCRKDAASGLYEVVELTAENAAATVLHDGVETPYNTVDQARRAVTDGDTLTLKVDHEGSLAFTAQNVTIDLGGKTLTGASNSHALSFNQSATADNRVTVKNGTIVAKGQDAACIRATSGDAAKTLTVVLGDGLTPTAGSNNRSGRVVLAKGARTAAPCADVNNGGLRVTEDGTDWIYGETETAFIHANGAEVTLLNDWYSVDYDGTIKVPETAAFASAKLNLGGHTVKAYGGAAIVMGDDAKPAEGAATKSLEISNGVIHTSSHGAAVCGSNKTLVLDGVQLTTTGDGKLGLYANGMTSGNAVTLKNGSALTAEQGTGLYFPGAGTLTVADSAVTGAKSGIEIRAGVLNVSGTSEIASTAAAFSFENNDNGVTTTGAAVAAVKHTVGNDLTVNISGGTFKGPRGFYANDPNPTTGGSVAVAISGGAFSTEPEADYVAADCKVTRQTDEGGAALYVVGPAVTTIDVTLDGAARALPFPDAWLAANIGAAADGWTPEALAAPAANGLAKWQCYLFGLSTTDAAAAIVAVAGQGTAAAIPLTVQNADASDSLLVADGYVTVAYRLMGSDDGTAWTPVGDVATKADGLAIPLEAKTYKLYRADVVVTPVK